MKTLKDQIKLLRDLKKRHEIAGYRYFTRESQAILIELITQELKDWPYDEGISEELQLTLLLAENLISSDIQGLCLLYRKVVRLRVQAENHAENSLA
jgi:hypothetical protein